jgi:4-hydroxyphenylpyruvate dioxygenase
MPDPLRVRTLDRGERKSDVMQALGTDLVLVSSNFHPLAIDEESRAAADLAEMAEHASPRGLFDGIEYLEFAVDDDAGRRLGETLAGWDFTMSATIAPSRSICSARGASTWC